jgi:hypothetical protein
MGDENKNCAVKNQSKLHTHLEFEPVVWTPQTNLMIFFRELACREARATQQAKQPPNENIRHKYKSCIERTKKKNDY